MDSEDTKEGIDFSTKFSSVEPWAPHPDGGLVYLRVARFDEIETLHGLTVHHIGQQVAPLKAMQDVYSHNPEALWVIFRSPTPNRAEAGLAGYYGFLHLNSAGLEALNNRTLKPRNPDLALLAPAGERPAAVYIWAVVARKLIDVTLPLIGKALGIRRYGGLPFYATAGTMGGLNRLKSYGFGGASPDQDDLGGLFHFYVPSEAERTASSAA